MNLYRTFVERYERKRQRDYLEDLGLDRRIILEWILEE